MSKRRVQEISTDEQGRETHPAFGHVHANRVTSHPGAVLFDSEIRHSHYVVLSIATADRQRDLNHDYIHASIQPFVEVAMSESQWAALVSGMNSGGTPCTIEHREASEEYFTPGLPYEPRMQHSMDEVRGAADRMFDKAQEAMAAYEAHKTVGNLRNLKRALESARPNVEFAAESMAKHAEGVVQRAQADIEAMVHDSARRVGIDPQEVVVSLATSTREDRQITDGQEQ